MGDTDVPGGGRSGLGDGTGKSREGMRGREGGERERERGGGRGRAPTEVCDESATIHVIFRRSLREYYLLHYVISCKR